MDKSIKASSAALLAEKHVSARRPGPCVIKDTHSTLHTHLVLTLSLILSSVYGRCFHTISPSLYLQPVIAFLQISSHNCRPYAGKTFSAVRRKRQLISLHQTPNKFLQKQGCCLVWMCCGQLQMQCRHRAGKICGSTHLKMYECKCLKKKSMSSIFMVKAAISKIPGLIPGSL